VSRLPVTAARPQSPSRQYSGPQEASVRSVTAAGVMFSLINSAGVLSAELLGPARWQRPVVPAGAPADPPAGTHCLVEFVGSGVDRPWVVAFSGWPS
jgi:hypothetical protein